MFKYQRIQLEINQIVDKALKLKLAPFRREMLFETINNNDVINLIQRENYTFTPLDERRIKTAVVRGSTIYSKHNLIYEGRSNFYH